MPLGLQGKRHLAGELSLFAAKKRRKNRHRFEAVDADQGCGPGPGDAATLRRPSHRLWPVSKENDLKWRDQKVHYKREESCWFNNEFPVCLPCARGGAAQRRRGWFSTLLLSTKSTTIYQKATQGSFIAVPSPQPPWPPAAPGRRAGRGRWRRRPRRRSWHTPRKHPHTAGSPPPWSPWPW